MATLSGSHLAARTAQKSHYPPGNHMLATSKNVLFPGHNHLLLTSNHRYWWPDTDYCLGSCEWRVISTRGNRWLWPGNWIFLEVASMVVTWWIVVCLPSAYFRQAPYPFLCGLLYHWSGIRYPQTFLPYTIVLTVVRSKNIRCHVWPYSFFYPCESSNQISGQT